jgi:CheY-like chemotaxis protein
MGEPKISAVPPKAAQKGYNMDMDSPQPLLLVVEDIPDTLKLVEVTLTFKGYRVATATNGHEALRAIEKQRPALIITDILMPHMDGFSLVHRLRIDPGTRDIPVIFLSATYVAPEDKAFAKAIGVTRFFEKPINLEGLLGTISELLRPGAHFVGESLDERVFYEGYRKRLEIKLRQKITQIAAPRACSRPFRPRKRNPSRPPCNW